MSPGGEVKIIGTCPPPPFPSSQLPAWREGLSPGRRELEELFYKVLCKILGGSSVAWVTWCCWGTTEHRWADGAPSVLSILGGPIKAAWQHPGSEGGGTMWAVGVNQRPEGEVREGLVWSPRRDQGRPRGGVISCWTFRARRVWARI